MPGPATGRLRKAQCLQEQSVTFVPKVAAMVVAGVVFFPWIGERMVAYTRAMLSSLPW